ncbi:hypothetical protein RchiOBHm_Chr4g0402301 [Rosa chinensis]|uniref:Uncharacterized protein n=1 Tax=Rosa chinensis TaxID=74649 RepID=A0A2P6QT97_ROSCH|nr:hypothetical protein RchiOBHm_Chr4g0402301 [Rosa chinensis]
MMAEYSDHRGSRVGEEFLIWPQTGYPEELFKVSDLTSNSLSGLEIATNGDIIGIALANLVRLHWKPASRSTHELMLTSPLRHVHNAHDKLYKITNSKLLCYDPKNLGNVSFASYGSCKFF